MQAQEIIVKSVAETQEFAGKFVEKLNAGTVVGLYGQLGSGKTTFVQGMAKILGINQLIGSPTFKLISEYQGKTKKLYHIDCYRINNISDFLNIGGEDYLYPENAITVIEWADIISAILPENTITVTLKRIPNKHDYRKIIT